MRGRKGVEGREGEGMRRKERGEMVSDRMGGEGKGGEGELVIGYVG